MTPLGTLMNFGSFWKLIWKDLEQHDDQWRYRLTACVSGPFDHNLQETA